MSFNNNHSFQRKALLTLPVELLQEICSYLGWRDLRSCLYQNSILLQITIPLIWRNLGDKYWESYEKTPLRWNLIKRTLFSSTQKTNTFNLKYHKYIQRIDISSSHDATFRIDKLTLGYLLTNCLNLTEISLEYYKESSFDEPFQILQDLQNSNISICGINSQQIISPIRKLTIQLCDLSPIHLIHLLSLYITTLEEMLLEIILERDPLELEDLRRLVRNNKKLKKLKLYTIQSERCFEGKSLRDFANGAELPVAQDWWNPNIV
ncbi:7420_t:CDS:1 [Gigaspora margarita]|uniref:7420_t:CDS:1 n=1 Tax=Gigaspora margarita TaxID=4874 RepID=A0ABN7UIT2_GIGMA|nr:7420_t:CDS:1 [Gigaspora margarita]